ncbi:MAG TPA: gliding motility lipoprotein GldD [Cyclobacteriaceae bacterium]
MRLSTGLLSLFCIFIGLSGCQTEYRPKPKGFNRLVLPLATYQATPDSLPYFFEYSTFATLKKDTSQVSAKDWVEVWYPSLHASVHITYKKLNGSISQLKEYLNDAYILTAKHQIKAYAIEESISKTPSGKTAIIAEIDGEVPSQFQFTLTDSSKNFLRGALYFNLKVQNDSLRPAIDYVKKDVMHMINTVSWK